MKQVLQYVCAAQTQAPYVFSAPVYQHDGRVYYVYPWEDQLVCEIVSTAGSVQFVCPEPDVKRIALPCDWKMFLHQGHVILNCGNQWKHRGKEVCSIFLDLDAGMVPVILPAHIEQENLCTYALDDTADVVLEDCILRYKNSRSIQCFTRDGELLWTEKHKGYRYTPFEERNGCIIFGTAGGYGGGLYCYRRSDGECLCAVDTKGTPSYIWCGGNIVTRGREGQLLLVAPFGGGVQKELILEGKFTDYSAYHFDGKYLCAVGFQKKTNAPHLYLFEMNA